MPWTEEDRRGLLARLEYMFTPEQIARLPKAVQRGDRGISGKAERLLWRELEHEFTWKKAQWQREQFAELDASDLADFDEDVIMGKRPMTIYELRRLQDAQYVAWVVRNK